MVPGLRGFSTLIIAGLVLACGGRPRSTANKSSDPAPDAATNRASGAAAAGPLGKASGGGALAGSSAVRNPEGAARGTLGARTARQSDSTGATRPDAEAQRASSTGASTGRDQADEQQSAAAAEAARLHLYVEAHLNRAPLGADRTDGLLDRIQWIKNLGFVGSRIDFEWPGIEPRKNDFEWSVMDSVVAASRRAGLKLYGLLLYTPKWARPDNTSGHERPVIAGSARAGDAAFAHFAAETARRYRGKVDAWEIWNEPNIPNFWSHVDNGREMGPDPQDYLSLYRTARDSIHASAPKATVIPAGLSTGPRTLPPTISWRRKAGYPAAAYLDALLGAGMHPAIVTVHPYTNRPIHEMEHGRPVNPIMKEVEHVLDLHHLSDTHLWVTEWGIDASRAQGPKKLQSWYSDGLHALACDPRVSVVTIYELAKSGPKDRYGLLKRNGTPTVNGAAMDSVLEHWKSCP